MQISDFQRIQKLAFKENQVKHLSTSIIMKKGDQTNLVTFHL